MPINPVIPNPLTSGFVTTPAPVMWSDGTTPFDGYVWIGLVLPASEPSSNQPYLYASQRPQALPQFAKIPVIGGVIDQTTQLYYNSTINPPGTKYVAYWFDRQNNLVAPASGTAVAFTITGQPTNLTAPTLTIPSLGTPPVPQT